jgi:GNAT superfamily N-acetyltransferase
LETPRPGHYWKTPFYWESGCPVPPSEGRLRFEPVSDEALRPTIGAVMASSMDGSDRFTVPRIGVDAAVQEVFDLLPQYFDRRSGWWRVGKDPQGRTVGFVLPVTFKEERYWKDARPQGTIFYMGVLPGFRGLRYGLDLVLEATRVFLDAGCWRIFCDTGTDNAPMVEAFRQAGYLERAPWQRPLA